MQPPAHEPTADASPVVISAPYSGLGLGRATGIAEAVALSLAMALDPGQMSLRRCRSCEHMGSTPR